MIVDYSLNQAQANLGQLLNQVWTTHQPVSITQESDKKFVVLSEFDYRSICETAAIMAVPGLAQSIIDADNEPKETFSKELPW